MFSFVSSYFRISLLQQHVQYRHDSRYSLRDIQYDYLPELTPKKEKKPGRKKKILHLFNVYTLHNARLRDLAELVQLRNGDVEGHRETILFLYRYWCCCFTGDPQEALQQTLDFNQTFTTPLTQKEAVKATESAQKAWKAKSDKQADDLAKSMGYPGAGYRISNAKLIDWLDITPEEQQHLKTIIGPKEKNRRKRNKYQEDREYILQKKAQERRDQGIRTMAEYNQDRADQKESMKTYLWKTIQENPKASIRKLAQMTGLSKTRVGELKKELGL